MAVAADRARHLAGRDQIQVLLSDPLVVWGDSDRLEQIFINLFTNAIQHNPVGTRIWVKELESVPGRVRLSVDDDGQGLPLDVFEYLNGRRYDLDTDRGLGMRLVRGFVTAQSGTITATTSSEGTSIMLDLPAEPEES